jgi:uncharacterized protein (TIGR02996 family)
MIAAFLQAIRDAPDDDTPRLVFADWLDEHGDRSAVARAELFRVQCELARWVPELDRRRQLQQREAELLHRHGDEWLGVLPTLCLDYSFGRGLVQLTLSGACFDRGSKLLAGTWVESLRVREADPYLDRIVSHPLLEQVTRLDLDGNGLDDEAVRALCSSPCLRHLACLDLANNRLTDRALDHLANSPHLGRLTALDVRNNRLTAAGVAALLDSSLGGRLRRLEVHGNDLGASVLLALERRYPQPRVVNSAGMTLTLIPAGTFLMGTPDAEVNRFPDERPLHAVTLTRPFYLGVYPVTQRQYLAVMGGSNPSTFDPGNGGSLDHPVDNVTWASAWRFCRWLNARPEERKLGHVYRLPTEAEWEHACRAGTRTPFWFGESISSWQANFDSRSPYGGPEEATYRGSTSRVGLFDANPFGLYDVHGNVWEWCQDWYASSYAEGGKNPQGPVRGDHKVMRGGSWDSTGLGCRSGHRGMSVYPSRASTNGLRVAMTIEGTRRRVGSKKGR